MQLILIGFFGLCGIFSRYFIDQLIIIRPSGFPLSTIVVNMLGSFLAGYLFYISKNIHSSFMTTALIVGLCGGLTTFSSFSVQILALAKSEYAVQALIYMFLSPILGLIFAFIGHKFASFVLQ